MHDGRQDQDTVMVPPSFPSWPVESGLLRFPIKTRVKVGILMLTSETSVEAETECLAAGADDYILKPVEPRRLAARVKALRARARSVSSSV